MQESTRTAIKSNYGAAQRQARATRPRSLIAAAVIALIWLLALIGLGALALRRAG